MNTSLPALLLAVLVAAGTAPTIEQAASHTTCCPPNQILWEGSDSTLQIFADVQPPTVLSQPSSPDSTTTAAFSYPGELPESSYTLQRIPDLQARLFGGEDCRLDAMDPGMVHAPDTSVSAALVVVPPSDHYKPQIRELSPCPEISGIRPQPRGR